MSCPTCPKLTTELQDLRTGLAQLRDEATAIEAEFDQALLEPSKRCRFRLDGRRRLRGMQSLVTGLIGPLHE